MNALISSLSFPCLFVTCNQICSCSRPAVCIDIEPPDLQCPMLCICCEPGVENVVLHSFCCPRRSKVGVVEYETCTMCSVALAWITCPVVCCLCATNNICMSQKMSCRYFVGLLQASCGWYRFVVFLWTCLLNTWMGSHSPL